jgi:hypothetical protein
MTKSSVFLFACVGFFAFLGTHAQAQDSLATASSLQSKTQSFGLTLGAVKKSCKAWPERPG